MSAHVAALLLAGARPRELLALWEASEAALDQAATEAERHTARALARRLAAAVALPALVGQVQAVAL